MKTLQNIEAIFFDIRDTLGVVDRAGHLIAFKPTTLQLLGELRDKLRIRLGVITNLPDNVSSEAGRQMIAEAGILEYLDPDGFMSNHDLGFSKPDPRIFKASAERLKLKPEQCLFCGENLIEVLAAEVSGMRTVLKPFPPGRDFLRQLFPKDNVTATDSGRLAERLLEEEHMVGKRIVMATAKIVQVLSALPENGVPPMRAMSLLVWLLHHFVDPFHHRKEEEVLIPFALARGLDPAECDFVYREHEQGRLYFAALSTAIGRVRAGDRSALRDFRMSADAFVQLYRDHGRKEDDLLLKKVGDLLTDADDSLMVDLMNRIGPADITLYYQVISELEMALL